MHSRSARSFVIIGNSPDHVVHARQQLRRLFPQAPIAIFKSTSAARDYIDASAPDAIIDAFATLSPEEALTLEALQRKHARVQIVLDALAAEFDLEKVVSA